MKRFLLSAAIALLSSAATTAPAAPWRAALLDRHAAGGADLTIRNAYTTPAITTASGGSNQTVVAWATTDRQNLIVRNPVGSPGSIRLMTKPGTLNSAIDTSAVGTLVATLAPGEEYYDTAGQTIYLAQSNDAAGSVPANLALQVYAEFAGPGASLPAAASGKRAITASPYKRHTITGQSWISDASPPLLLSRDGTTFYRRNPANKQQLQESTNYADLGASATWTTDATIGVSTSNTGITGVTELANGEIMVSFLTNNTPCCYLYRSTGWAAGHSTATFAKVLTSVGGSFQPNYSGHQFGNGSNGVMIVAEAGAQTTGGSANATADATRATRVFLSQDFGVTFATVCDLRDYGTAQGFPYPATMHVHGVAYDESWDRLYVLYGDDNGDGKNIAGNGNSEVVYSDDRGTTWTKLASFQNWANASGYHGQFIAMSISPSALTFTPDVSSPIAPFVLRKTGYRQYGAAELLLGASGGVNGMSTRGTAATFLTGNLNGGNYVAAGSYTAGIMASADGLAWDQISIPETLTASGAVGALRVFGPTASGKLVTIFDESNARMSGGNVLIGTLVYQ